MKRLYDASKKHVLDKLKYISAMMDILANIFKSFATIVGSLVAGTTAGVTGYFEVKKMIKKEHHQVKTEIAATSSGPNTTTTMMPPSQLEVDGYKFDVNSGAFVISILMLAFLVFKKLKKAPDAKN